MKTDKKINLGSRKIESLSPPQSGREYWYDIKTEGLALCLTPSGGKTFYLYKWCVGRPVRILLGRYPAMTVEQARKQAKALVGDMARGHDPQSARQAARHEQTVGGLFTFWLESHAKARKRTWKEDRRQYDTFLKPWANRKLSAVKKGDVQALHARVGEKNGIYAANRMLALLRAMFNKAPDMGFTGVNPAKGVKRFKEVKRDRFLHGDDLKRFFDALAAEPNLMIQHFFLLLLLTGARRSNVQAMAWADIDFQTGLWRIPETKSGVPVVVPLTAPAVAVLQARQTISNGSPWVFPSCGATGHIVEPKSAWKRIIKHAGLVDVRPHDLRRSLGSWMAIGGASLPVVGKMLGHSQPATTAIYARLSVDPVRQAAETATAAMMEYGGLKLIDNGGASDGATEEN
jgi:integrase